MTDRTQTQTTQTTLDALQILVAATPYAPQAAKELVTTQPNVVTKRATPSTKKLDKVQRDAAKEESKYASLGDAMMQVGESIGYYSVEHDIAQETTIGVVSTILKDAMKQGLEVAMLKAPTKSEPRECYTCLVTALQAVRTAAGLTPLKDATRDNYLSRIRAFVKARGAEPLDLFGNIAVKKAEQDRKLNKTAKPVDSADAGDGADTDSSKDSDATPTARGIPALHAFLTEWTKQNDVGMVVEKYRKMVADMVNAIETDLPSLKAKAK